MATETRAGPTPPASADPLRPTFEARRFVVPSAGLGAGSERGVPSPADGGWRWIGDPETLGRFGARPGGQIDPSAYERVERGWHLEGDPGTDPPVRKANTVDRDLDDPQRAPSAPGRQPTHVHGLVHVSGTYRAPKAINQAWAEAGPEERETIKRWLVAEATAGIERISKTDRFAGGAVVRADDDGLRVDTVTFAADRGKGIATPYHRRGIQATAAFAAERAALLGGRVELPAEPPPQVELPPRPAAQVEEPAVDIPSPRGPRAPLPVEPLRDSLSATYAVLGDAAAGDIKRRAELAAETRELGDLSSAELRKLMPESNPFEELPSIEGRTRASMKAWWRQHGRDAVRTVAVEETLIDRAREGYRELAQRECARLGTEEPDRMKPVRAHGERAAAKVERRAAVLASHLGSMSERERLDRAEKVDAEIGSTGLENASFEAVSRWVAVGHGRNADNEREAARDRFRGQEEAGIGY